MRENAFPFPKYHCWFLLPVQSHTHSLFPFLKLEPGRSKHLLVAALDRIASKGTGPGGGGGGGEGGGGGGGGEGDGDGPARQVEVNQGFLDLSPFHEHEHAVPAEQLPVAGLAVEHEH